MQNDIEMCSWIRFAVSFDTNLALYIFFFGRGGFEFIDIFQLDCNFSFYVLLVGMFK